MHENVLLADRVFKRLLAMIMMGEIPLDEPLRETQIAERLGVSRTPVREGLLRLAEYGLVEWRPNRSAVVRQLGGEELTHIHQVREALEGMAAELACGRLTREDFDRLESLAQPAGHGATALRVACRKLEFAFHATIAQRSGNPILAREIVRLHHLVILFHDQHHLGGGRRDCERGRRDHLAILKLLKSGDARACRRAMVEHVRFSLDYALRSLPAQPAEKSSLDDLMVIS